ncbi:nucleoside hydrolase [Asticcacaulis taihuensis]|uniref:nucleoside hydrolase n=1 Tax=Asticcacaulis taihuensis TaxID=260084 RepID=UPI0026F20BC0|nr:nucleoside hydrolase [Asticcacaulis taihuensis]
MPDIARRTFLITAAAASCAGECLADNGRARARLIVDNDFAGDPDGIAALVHQLLSPTTHVSLITTSALDQTLARMAGAERPDRTAQAGFNLADETVRRIKPATPPNIVAGADTFGVSQAQVSAAAEAIVAEANRSDPLPLFLTCGGPLTNLAAALRIDPSIATKMTVIWIGGGGYPAGGPEYNLMTDLESARLVIERSQVPVWQIPETTYRTVTLAFSELEWIARRDKGLALWTYERLTDVPSFVKLDGARGIGDSAMVLLTALSSEAGHYLEMPARRILDGGQYGEPIPARMLRVYDRLDADLVVRDFLARLQLFVTQ